MDIAQISTNSFILLAHRSGYDWNNSVIVKIDLNGNVIYQKLIRVGNDNRCNSFSSINDTLFISCFFWGGFYHQSRIIAVDTLGNAFFLRILILVFNFCHIEFLGHLMDFLL